MEYHEKLYDVEVINRFTKKLYKVYRNKTLGGVFSIQDEHLCHMWKKKVEVYPLFDVLEEMRNAHDS